MKIKPQESLSPMKKSLFTFILIFLLILTTLIIGEIYIRLTHTYINLWALTGRETSIKMKARNTWALVDAFCAYKGRPGIYRRTKKTVNKYGFISTPEISLQKPKNTIRVVFLGGSSTAGTGYNLADEDTWPFRVMEILKDNFKDKEFEFLNAALGGYTTFESFGRLWSRIRFFSPDIIVVYHGWNEMYYFNCGDNIVNWRTLPDGSWGFVENSKLIICEPHWIDHLIRYSQLLILLRLGMSKEYEGEVSKTKEIKEIKKTYNKRGLNIFRTNLCLIRETAAILDAKLFVVKQATLIVPNLNEKDRDRCHYEFHGFDHDAHVDAFNQIYRIIDEEIDYADIIDATGISGTSEYFNDHIHPNELGSKKIAEIIAQSLYFYLDTLEKRN